MSEKIKLVLIGLGNVSSTLIKGLQFYQTSSDGLWHPKLAGFSVSDIEITGIYDIDPSKVGKKISQVISDYSIDLDMTVQPGIAEDPTAHNSSLAGETKHTKYEDFVMSLKQNKPDFVVNLISSGMDKSGEKYAQASLEVGCSFFNATASKITTEQRRSEFASKGSMILGDDLMSQFGGTAFHRGIMEFITHRGIKIEKAYQLDVGGNQDTQNTMAEEIRERKRKIKTESIAVEVPYPFKSTAGTTEYAEQLANSRVSYYWMEAKGFLGSTIEMDLALRTNDSTNGCNIILDAIRAAKMAISKKDLNKSEIISAYGFKNPPKKFKIRESIKIFEAEFA